MQLRRLTRTTTWDWEQIDCSPSQFRKSLRGHVADQAAWTKWAIHAGKMMGKQLVFSGLPFRQLSKAMIEDWRKRYGVPKRLRKVMLAVAEARSKYPRNTRKLVRKDEKLEVLGLNDTPRVAARKMVDRYGTRAEAMIRRVRKVGRKRKEAEAYWREVGRAVWKLRNRKRRRTPPPIIPTDMGLAELGCNVFMKYLHQQQDALKVVHQIKCETPIEVESKRLISERESKRPRLCIATVTGFGPRQEGQYEYPTAGTCGKPAELNRMFCKECQP